MIKIANEEAAANRLVRDAEIKKKEANERRERGEPELDEDDQGEGSMFRRATNIQDARKQYAD